MQHSINTAHNAINITSKSKPRVVSQNVTFVGSDPVPAPEFTSPDATGISVGDGVGLSDDVVVVLESSLPEFACNVGLFVVGLFDGD